MKKFFKIMPVFLLMLVFVSIALTLMPEEMISQYLSGSNSCLAVVAVFGVFVLISLVAGFDTGQQMGTAILKNLTDMILVLPFPWAGFQYDLVNGSVDFDIPAGPMATMPYSSDIDENDIYTVGGLNFKANIYFTRYLGVSYRFKYSELGRDMAKWFEDYPLQAVS